LDGYWEWWRENGKPLQAGSFDCGQQVGSWKRYYDNGQLWDEGNYEGGKKVDEWKVYKKNGELKQTKVFKLKK
jgi:antitoxin component YwqK of YwqJK toxin-antitoxin module